jgi:hypothetical protein
MHAQGAAIGRCDSRFIADQQALDQQDRIFDQRMDLHVAGYDECRVIAEYCLTQQRRGDCGENDRNEACDGVFHHDHFHREDDAGERRVEGTGDRGSGTAGDERANAVVGQVEKLPEQAAHRCAEVDRGTLASP